ncbi:rRNA maturation RNase YbeY [Aerococcaceae bacterium NML190073]|nr:rRNA maturation RNase YbeY [Aerococcaceae bacterium NML190073]MCW6674692.1 rRNA maturation RNase YbeY [Aerococcaceae bacterium NML171108]MCW6676651.1 rRNA maturation RNase YbeY [Aerococcaceae bacterium NML180378]
MLIDIIDDSAYLNASQTQLIQDIIVEAAHKLQLGEHIEVDISIVSNETIQQLNRDYRNIDKPTDVLSFALEEVDSEFDIDFEALNYDESDEDESTAEDDMADLARHLGDIIISYPRAQEQAEEYGHSLERELAFLAVHGFLHLNGYDHQTEAESAAMFTLQEEVLASYGLTR